MTLHSVMGLNYLGCVDLSSLGMRVRKISLKVERTSLEYRESSTIFQTYSLIIGQQWWKKSMVKPSGPGAFPGWNLFHFLVKLLYGDGANEKDILFFSYQGRNMLSYFRNGWRSLLVGFY
jgi:hypothetical protein